MTIKNGGHDNVKRHLVAVQVITNDFFPIVTPHNGDWLTIEQPSSCIITTKLTSAFSGKNWTLSHVINRLFEQHESKKRITSKARGISQWGSS